MLRVPLITLAFILFSGCSSFGGTDSSELDNARASWARAGISDYDYELTVGCFCFGSGTYLVEVRNSAVANVTPVAVEIPANSELAEKTVEDLFAVLAGAYAQNAAVVDVNYDGGLGYPLSISIDYNAQTADDEISFAVDGFERLD